MPFHRHVPGRHVANANHCQITDFTLSNESLNIFVIPRIPVE